MAETKNARIRDTVLGIEDHGIMTFMLNLEYDGSGQGAGGYGLDGYDKDKKRRYGYGTSITMLRRILEVVGVETWEQLPGKHIRVRATHEGVEAIGNIVKDDWLDFKQFFDSNKEDS